MTIVTPDAGDLGLEELFGSVQAQIKELREDIESLKEETKAGEEFETKSAKEMLTRLKGLVGQCSGLEKILAECRNKQQGIVQGGYALNINEARSEIGRALDRIRERGGAGEVSE